MNPLISRRSALQTLACGFGHLALAGLAAQRTLAAANPLSPKKPHFLPKAKRVIFLFMQGGVSQVDSFDYKPILEKEDGNRFALGAYPELLRVVSVVEDAARASDKRIRPGQPPWLATPEAQIAGGLRQQLEERGISCRYKANEPYRRAAAWIWPYLELSGDPARHLREALSRPASGPPPAPVLPAWPPSSTTR